MLEMLESFIKQIRRRSEDISGNKFYIYVFGK